MRLLIVEDDDMLRGYLARTFTDEGHCVDAVETGEEGLEAADRSRYDLILLDIELPGMNGFAVVRSLRKRGKTTPLIILTSHEHEEGLVRSLDLGADDFVRKPFSMAELRAHARALLRRANEYRESILTYGELELDLRRRKAARNDTSIHLTEVQFKLLLAIMTRCGGLVSRREILKEVWGMDFEPQTKILDVQLTYLRKKLNTTGPPLIETVRGKGYRLVPKLRED